MAAAAAAAVGVGLASRIGTGCSHPSAHASSSLSVTSSTFRGCSLLRTSRSKQPAGPLRLPAVAAVSTEHSWSLLNTPDESLQQQTAHDLWAERQSETSTADRDDLSNHPGRNPVPPTSDIALLQKLAEDRTDYLYQFELPRRRFAMPGVRGVDHMGLTVPDLAEAVAFFVDILGCEECFAVGPFKASDDWMKVHLNVHPAAQIAQLRMLRCGNGSNFELFEFVAPGEQDPEPRLSDCGGKAPTFFVDDIDEAVVHLKSRGIEVLGNVITMQAGPTAPRPEVKGVKGLQFIYFRAPWGLMLRLCSYTPDSMAYLHQHPGQELPVGARIGAAGQTKLRIHKLREGNMRQWCPKPFHSYQSRRGIFHSLHPESTAVQEYNWDYGGKDVKNSLFFQSTLDSLRAYWQPQLPGQAEGRVITSSLNEVAKIAEKRADELHEFQFPLPNTPPVPGLWGVDNFLLQVPDMVQALDFFINIMGCEQCYVEGPFMAEDDFIYRQLGVHPHTQIVQTRLLRCQTGSNIQLLEFASPEQNTKWPSNSDIGGYHLCFFVDDIYVAVDFLKASGITLFGDVTTMQAGPTGPRPEFPEAQGLQWIYFQTPWGAQMELCSYGPDGMAYLHQSGGYEGQGGKSGTAGIRSHVLKLGNVRQWCPKPFW